MINSMRATITIRDDLFEAADEIAEELGVSRSRLIQDALERYLRLLKEQGLTEQMNAHIEKHGSSLDPAFLRYVARAWANDMGDDEW